jgi:hypothetical protein
LGGDLRFGQEDRIGNEFLTLAGMTTKTPLEATAKP